MKKISIFFTVLLFFTEINFAQITIHTIGDSTMEQKSEDPVSNPNGQRGWAQMLSQFVMNGANVNDRAKSGTSSKTFYEDKDSNGNYRFWFTVTPQIKAGDYVFIQFAHNDEKDGGWQSTHDGVTYTGIGTNPWEQYTAYLTRYVNEVRAIGAIPILFTPIVRNGFSGTTMTPTACHNIGTDSVGRPLDYPAAMRKVASDMGCAIVDHTLITKAYCESIGASQTSTLIYNVGDGTHLGIFGATLYARLAVKELLKQGILTNYFNANPDLLISNSTLDFGKSYPNGSTVSVVSFSGTDLDPADGTLTITAPNGYLLSTSQGGTFSKSLQYPYTLGTINLTNFYVKFTPTEIGSYNDSIILTNGVKTKKIIVKGDCVALTGQNARVFWELITSPGSPIVEGPVTALTQKYSNMVLQNYAVPNATTIWTGGLIANGTKTQRNTISTTNNTWPAGEIDIVNDRYIQFGVSAIKGSTFNIDSIGFYAGGAGGSGMRFKAYISKDSLFSDTQTTVMIADRGTVTNAANTMYPIQYNKLIELAGEQNLYLRIYPWYNGTASGKTICLYGVLLKGNVITSGTAVSEITSNQDFECSLHSQNDKIKVSFYPKNKSDVQILICSVDGKTIEYEKMTNIIPGTYQEKIIDTDKLSPGIYLCNVKTGNLVKNFKFIK